MLEADASECLRCLGKSHILAYPTETVWGLGADISKPKALDRLFELKQRDPKKPVSLLVRDLEMARLYAVIDRFSEKLIEIFWPGPVTFVLPATPRVPEKVRGHSEWVGLRCSSHPFVRDLMWKMSHPMTTTSANISGKSAALSLDDLGWLQNYSWVDIVRGEALPLSSGSTVVRVESESIKILREGIVQSRFLLKVADRIR